MAHVELSLSSAFVPQARTPVEAEFLSSAERWTSTVAAAAEPCLIVDVDGVIQVISPICSELLGLGKPIEAAGKRLSTALRLIDFTAAAGALEEPEAEKIPPLMAVRTESLARGLMRVAGDPPLTVDAVSTPLLNAEQVVGSLTFFSPVRY